jgi:hypothetical protein
VWENPDEDFTLTFQVTSDRDTTGLDLHVLDPSTIQCLKSELAEIQLVTARGDARAATAHALTKF